jgi:hypothetical protein
MKNVFSCKMYSYTFAPPKCAILSDFNLDLYLYNERIPVVNSFDNLALTQMRSTGKRLSRIESVLAILSLDYFQGKGCI